MATRDYNNTSSAAALQPSASQMENESPTIQRNMQVGESFSTSDSTPSMNLWNNVSNRAREGWQKISKQTDPFIRERPYMAMGVAAVAGFLLSLVLKPRRTR